jgi:hypothetical protein
MRVATWHIVLTRLIQVLMGFLSTEVSTLMFPTSLRRIPQELPKSLDETYERRTC